MTILNSPFDELHPTAQALQDQLEGMTGAQRLAAINLIVAFMELEMKDRKL